MPIVIVPCGVSTFIAIRLVLKSSIMVCGMVFLTAIAVPLWGVLSLLLVYVV